MHLRPTPASPSPPPPPLPPRSAASPPPPRSPACGWSRSPHRAAPANAFRKAHCAPDRSAHRLPTTGRSSAAARCSGPVSPAITTAARRASAINCPTEHGTARANPSLASTTRSASREPCRRGIHHRPHAGPSQLRRHPAKSLRRPDLRAPSPARRDQAEPLVPHRLRSPPLVHLIHRQRHPRRSQPLAHRRAQQLASLLHHMRRVHIHLLPIQPARHALPRPRRPRKYRRPRHPPHHRRLHRALHVHAHVEPLAPQHIAQRAHLRARLARQRPPLPRARRHAVPAVHQRPRIEAPLDLLQGRWGRRQSAADRSSAARSPTR